MMQKSVLAFDRSLLIRLGVVGDPISKLLRQVRLQLRMSLHQPHHV
jgi:hypothetical protein